MEIICLFPSALDEDELKFNDEPGALVLTRIQNELTHNYNMPTRRYFSTVAQRCDIDFRLRFLLLFFLNNVVPSYISRAVREESKDLTCIWPCRF